MNRVPTRAALALAILALALGPRLGVAQPDDLPAELRTIAGLRFEGRRHLSVRDLKAANLKTRKPSVFPWREKPSLRGDYLETDRLSIQSLYRHYGYLDAHVNVRLESTRDPGAARVVFHIDEGHRSDIAAVILPPLASYPERELRRALYARPGRPFDPAFLHLDTLRIAALYQERGHRPRTHAWSRRRVDDSLAVDVHYEIVEGAPYEVGEIQLQAPEPARHDTALARRELLLRRGETYRLSRMQRSVERLYQTGLYSQVQVTPRPDTARHVMDFDVRLAERKSRWVDVGVGSGTSALFNSTAEWGHRDLVRRGLQAALTGKAGFQTTDLFGGGRTHFQVANVQASLLEPWLFGIRLSSRGRLFVNREDFRNDTRYVLRQSTRGFGFDFYRELGRISRLTLQQESDEVHQSYGAPDVGGIPDSTLDSLSRSVVKAYRTNLVRSVLERDLRDNRISPTRGSYQSYTGEFSGGPQGGASSYNKHVLQSTWYTPLRNGWNVAARAGGGVIRPYGPSRQFTPDTTTKDLQVSRVPYENRFRLGGANSLRGYDENTLPSGGGLAFVQAGVELRVPIAGPFGFEFYTDTGNVWGRPEYVRASDFVAPWRKGRAATNDLRWTYGAGLRLVLPFGPVRLDFSRKSRADLGDEKHGFVPQFAIGSSF